MHYSLCSDLSYTLFDLPFHSGHDSAGIERALLRMCRYFVNVERLQYLFDEIRLKMWYSAVGSGHVLVSEALCYHSCVFLCYSHLVRYLAPIIFKTR